MDGTKKILLVAGALCLALTGTAQAGGFNIYEAGAKATALGCAFTATADDGSALFYNPAGIAFLAGSGIDLNLMPVAPDFEFEGADADWLDPVQGETVDQSFPLPGGYFYKTFDNDFSIGVGAYAPFGLGVKWMNPDTFVGRQVSYDVEIQTVDGKFGLEAQHLRVRHFVLEGMFRDAQDPEGQQQQPDQREEDQRQDGQRPAQHEQQQPEQEFQEHGVPPGGILAEGGGGCQRDSTACWSDRLPGPTRRRPRYVAA